jgi:hypothetical protein
MVVIDDTNIENLVNKDYSLLAVIEPFNNKEESKCFLFPKFNQGVINNFSSFDKYSPISILDKKKNIDSFKGKVYSSYVDNSNFLFLGLKNEYNNTNLIDLLSGTAINYSTKNENNPTIVSIDKLNLDNKYLPYLVTENSELIFMSNKKTISFKGKNNIEKTHSFLSHNNFNYLFAYCFEKKPEFKLFYVKDNLVELCSSSNFLDRKEKVSILKYKDYFITDVNGNQISLFIPNNPQIVNPLLNNFKTNNSIKKYKYHRIEKGSKQNGMYTSFEMIPSIKNDTINYIASYIDYDNKTFLEHAIINLKDQRYNYFKNIELPIKLKEGKISHLKIIYNNNLQNKIYSMFS